MAVAPVPGAVAPEPRLRVLVVTELFPNAVMPTFSIFNKLQCAALSQLCEVDVRATIPWFPGARRFKKWSPAGKFADVPAEEQIEGMHVRHPRFLFVPKIGRPLSPALYAASLWPSVRKLRGKIDVVLGCWAFPDGLASILLARRLGVACAVKVHGSDLNVLPQQRSLKMLLRWGLPRVDRLIAVSRPLGQRAIELGVPPARIDIVANGIDRAVFHPRDRGEARARLQLPGGRLVIYVGRLEAAKGVVDLAEAFRRLAPGQANLRVAFIGDGAARPRCEELAAAFPGRVFLTGALPMPAVADWIAASDILTLPSWNEGTPNVLLEALASGRRVVATNVGGIPDVVSSPRLGELVPARDVAALAEALARAVETPYDPQEMTSAAPHSWPESAARLRDALAAAVAHHRGAAA
ncbi:MAG TPA: glycosyltransferase family 4 protein [Polyangia bacterium]|jgi:glycosyltransferase involved in cell wall biosynthesis|nr:glycosyltransferase family 4 protein [Polyangia bacterium]